MLRTKYYKYKSVRIKYTLKAFIMQKNIGIIVL